MDIKSFLRTSSFFFIFIFTSFSFGAQKITVVGAGLAGLTTAYRLQSQGYSVDVYEARNRPGGRVLTIRMGDSFDELGGKFLSDGGDAENIRSLISEMGLEIEEYEIENSQRAYVYKGRLGDFYSAFLSSPYPTEELYSQLKVQSKEARSIGEILDGFFQGNPVVRQLNENRMRNYEGNDSKDLDVSYLESFWNWYWRAYEKALTDQAPTTIDYVKGGNSSLVSKLVDVLQGKIHYNSALHKITKTSEGKIQLHFEDKVVETDVLVLAMPCATLRDVQIQEGMIPDDQMHAIQTLQYGTNAKIAIPLKISVIDFSFTDNVCLWWDKTKSILTFYYGGAPGVFDSHSSQVVLDKIREEIPSLKLLDSNLSFPTDLTPTKVKDELFANYDEPVGISWINEQFSKGSYSSFGVGQYLFFNEKLQILGETVRKVFRPIDNQIFFAGEHTSLGYPGTMEAAVESGERTARMIIKEGS